MDNIINQKIERIDANLEKYLKIKYPEKIYEAIRYSVFAGGKRMRPLLLLSVCEALGGSEEKAMPFACALEMIHTYSLIHDDLPCMDDDDYRRGKLTNHKVYGEAMAVLAGDALLNLAYEIMSAACFENFSEKSIKAMFLIAKSAGVEGMVGGQVADVLSETKNIGFDELMYIHSHKTAAIISSAVMAGAVIADVSDADLLNLEEFAQLFGVAFQIKDDILDVIGDSKLMGKPVGSDAKNNKVTYVTHIGLEKSKEDYNKMLDKAFCVLKDIVGEDGFLQDYVKALAKRDF